MCTGTWLIIAYRLAQHGLCNKCYCQSLANELVLITFSPKKMQSVKNVTASECKRLISEEENLLILYIQGGGETAEGYLRDFCRLNFDGPELRESLSRLDRSMKYLVYCRSGYRSAHTSALMAQMGFKEIYNLIGGTIAWKGM